MQTLQQIALGYLGPFLNDLAGIFGWDGGTVDDIYTNVRGFITGTFWWLFTPPMAFIIGVWLAVKNFDAVIPGWVTDAVAFVTYTVKVWWDWQLTTVKSAAAWIKQAPTQIANIAQGIFNDSISAFQYSTNWLTKWLGSLGGQINDITQNFGKNVTDIVQKFWDTITAPLKPYWNNWTWVWNNFNQTLTAFLSNPGQYIQNLINNWIQALLAPFQPLLQFLAWWTNTGAPFLVSLVSDPLRVILDVIAPGFIVWAIDRIAEKW